MMTFIWAAAAALLIVPSQGGATWQAGQRTAMSGQPLSIVPRWQGLQPQSRSGAVIPMAYDKHSGMKKKAKSKASKPSRLNLKEEVAQGQQQQARKEEKSWFQQTFQTELAACPGAQDGEGTACDFDADHRVCAQLLDDNGEPLNWGTAGDFWQATGLGDLKWDKAIRANGGDSWCIDTSLTAKLINEVGCENVHIRCEATDVASVLDKWWKSENDDQLAAWECLAEGCPLQQALSSSTGNAIAGSLRSVSLAAGAGCAAGALFTAWVLALKRRPATRETEPLLG